MSATTSATQPILTPPNETVEVTVQRSNPWTNRRARTAIAVCVFTLVIDTSTVSAMDASRIEDLEVRACVARTVPDYSMTQRLDVQMLDDDGAISESSGYLSWKRFEDGRAKLVVSIVAPPERAGVAVLLIEREGANPDVFMYIPERRQVRPVGARTLGASMLGTDLSYEDFTHFQQMVDTGIATRLDDVTLDGHPVYVLENIPVDGKSAYSRILTYVDQKKCLPVKTEFFAPNGSLHKVLFVERQHVRKVSDRWVPFRVVMRDYKRDRRTVLATADIRINPAIRNIVFTPAHLRQGH